MARSDLYLEFRVRNDAEKTGDSSGRLRRLGWRIASAAAAAATILCGTGPAFSEQGRRTGAESGEQPEAAQAAMRQAREAAEAFGGFLRQGSQDDLETFNSIWAERRGEPEFRAEFMAQSTRLIRVDRDGRPTEEDAFIRSWMEEQRLGDEGLIDYSMLCQDVQVLNEVAEEAVDALRDFLLSGDAGDRERFNDSFRSEFMGRPIRENVFFARAFFRAHAREFTGRSEAGQIEEAYRISNARLAAALSDCYSRAGSGEVSEDAMLELEASYGAPFVERFIEFRGSLAMAGLDQEGALAYIEEHLGEERRMDEEAQEDAGETEGDGGPAEQPDGGVQEGDTAEVGAGADGGVEAAAQPDADAETVAAGGEDGGTAADMDGGADVRAAYGPDSGADAEATAVPESDGGAADGREQRVEALGQLRDELAFAISGLVEAAAEAHGLFGGDVAPDADAIRAMELEHGVRFVELIEERAEPERLDADARERRGRRFRLAFSDAFSMMLNIDTLMMQQAAHTETGVTGRNDFERSYLQMTVGERIEFERWAVSALDAWSRVDITDLSQVQAYFQEYFPNMPLPDESHIPRFRMVMQSMSGFVSYGRFDYEEYSTQLQESADALASYLTISGRTDAGEWTLAMQDAFTDSIVEMDSAARRGRAVPRRVSVTMGGEEGAELADSLVQAPHSAGGAGREEAVRILRRNVAIADMLVESVFGYNWTTMANLEIGGRRVLDDRTVRVMQHMGHAARLAVLHLSVMRNADFRASRGEFISYVSGPERSVDSLAAEREALDDAEDGDGEGESARETAAGDIMTLERMDLLSQYAFCAVAFPAMRRASLLQFEEVGEEVRMVETEGTDRVRFVMEPLANFIENSGRSAHLGFMLNAVPLSLDYATTYNEVVTILNRIAATAITIQHTSMYDYEGRGRVGFRYAMEQVPRNFEEANSDVYNQLIDLMLENPMASDYLSRDMEQNMFNVRTVGEMLRRFMRTMQNSSATIRPNDVLPYRAPQDFSLAGPMMVMEDSIRTRAGMSHSGILSDPQMLVDDELRERSIQEIIMGSGDERLVYLWRNNVDLHREFLHFFRPDSIRLVPERDYRVLSFIPMSVTSLLRRLSAVEGVDRLIYPIDMRYAGGMFSTEHDSASYERVSGGTAAERMTSSETEGEGEGRLLARVWGPRQEMRLEGDFDYHNSEDLDGMTETEAFAATESLFSRDTPLFRNDLATAQSMFRATESHDETRSGGDRPQLDEVMDIGLTDALEWFAHRSDTDGVMYIEGRESTERSERVSEDDPDATEVESSGSHDWRVHSYAKVDDRWYRVGYIDVSDEQMRRFFVAAQVPERLRDGGEVRALLGSEPRREAAEPETDADITVEEVTRLEGILVGINLSSLIGLSSPAISLANIENFGRAADQLMRDIPEDEQALMEERRVEEYAAGIGLLFNDSDAGERASFSWAGFTRTVGFLTGVGRRYSRTIISGTGDPEAPVSESEGPETWTGEAGLVGRASGPRETGEGRRAAEIGIAVGEEIGDTPVREVEIERTTTETDEDGDTVETTNTYWAPNGTELGEGERLTGAERITYGQRQERVGFTLGWQSSNLFVDRLHTIAMLRTEELERWGGLFGFMFDDTTSRGNDLHTFFMGGFNYDPIIENHEGYGVFGLRIGRTRMQFSGLYSELGLLSRLNEVNTRLESDIRELSELRSGEARPEDLAEARGRSERMEQLQREIEMYGQLRTALGIMGAQKFFGTGQVSRRFSGGTRMGVEGLYGGWGENHVLLNGFVEVPESVAAAANMTVLPFGSAGGKVVVPIREFTLALSGGGYWTGDGEYQRHDEQGYNAYGGLLWTRSDGRFGLGGIVGGSQRTSTLGDGEDILDVETRRVEAMVLGWHPAGRARMQHYLVFSREWGSNIWSLDVVPDSEFGTTRFGYGTLVNWVDRRGSVWTARTDFLYRHTDDERLVEGGRRFDEDTFSWQVGVEVSPTRNTEFGLTLSLHDLEDMFRDVDSVDAGASEYEFSRTRVGGMAYFRLNFW